MALIVARICDLFANIPETIHPEDSMFLVSRALDIDAELQRWVDDIPLELAYSKITISEPNPEVFSDNYEIHKNIFNGSVWNNYRAMRILLHEALLTHLLLLCEHSTGFVAEETGLFLSYDDLMQKSRMLCGQLTHDICASVPFYFNYHQEHLQGLWVRPDPQAIAGVVVMWPLYIAAIAGGGRFDPEMRDWIIGRLRRVAEVMGIRHASALATLVQGNIQTCLSSRTEGVTQEGVRDNDETEWVEYTKGFSRWGGFDPMGDIDNF